MSAPADSTGAGADALTFWRWLKKMGRYTRPPGLLNFTLFIATVVAAVAFSTVSLDWLFDASGLDVNANGRMRFVDSIFPPLWGGGFAYLTMLMTNPASGWNAIRVSLLALLAGFAATVGMVMSFQVVAVFFGDSGLRSWFLMPAWAVGTLPAVAIALGTAYRFRSPVSVVRHQSRDGLELIAGICVGMPLGFAAAFGFGFVHGWSAPADCGSPLGAATLGFCAVFSSGLFMTQAWRRAGPLRGLLLRRWGTGLLIVLAAVPLGHLFECTPATPISSATGNGVDRDAFFALFGGYAVLVYLAAGALAAWRMDNFLRQHGLRKQDWVAAE